MFDPNGTTELVASNTEAGAAPRAVVVTPGNLPEAVDVEASFEMTFWTSAQASDSPDEYEAYLARYPDGAFATLARARLKDVKGGDQPTPRAEDKQVELAFWDTVKESDNPAMFRAYVERFPSGAFVVLAEIRLAELEGLSTTRR